MADNIFFRIKKLFSGGFFHVVVSSVANKLIASISSILIVRALGKYEYGIFASANNILGIFAIFAGLGMSGAVLIYCSEKRDEEEKRAYYKYGLTSGLMASFAISICLLFYAFFGELGIPQARNYIIMLSMLPMLEYVTQHFLVVLRTRRDNKSYAKYTSLNSALYLLLGCAGACVWGIPGAILGRYCSYLIVAAICSRKVISLYSEGVSLSRNEKKRFWGYSLRTGLTSAINQLLYLVDVALIAALMRDAETVASYKVAVAIPEAMAFIPSSVMVYFIPVIAGRNDDNNWLKSNLKKLFIYSGIANIVISACLYILAPYIITILWGREYLDSVTCFRILCVNYFFVGTLRTYCTNILAAMRKVTFNLILSAAAIVINISLDYALILKYSTTGAAIATLTTVAFISAASASYLYNCVRRNGS